MKHESPDHLPDQERRDFLKIGLIVTGIFAGGTLISLISNVKHLFAPGAYREEYPYKPHYTMVIRQDRCIGCQRCMDGCVLPIMFPITAGGPLCLRKRSQRPSVRKGSLSPSSAITATIPPASGHVRQKQRTKTRQTGLS